MSGMLRAKGIPPVSRIGFDTFNPQYTTNIREFNREFSLFPQDYFRSRVSSGTDGSARGFHRFGFPQLGTAEKPHVHDDVAHVPTHGAELLIGVVHTILTAQPDAQRTVQAAPAHTAAQVLFKHVVAHLVRPLMAYFIHFVEREKAFRYFLV